MTTMHFEGDEGRPVGLQDVDSRDELDRAVISGVFEQQWVVDVTPTGASCRTCDHDCNHAGRVEAALRDHGLGGV